MRGKERICILTDTIDILTTTLIFLYTDFESVHTNISQFKKIPISIN